MHAISVEEAAKRMSEVIETIRRGGEVILTQDEQPVAKVVAPPWGIVKRDLSKPRPLDSAKGLIEVPDDFDEPLEDFAEYQ